MINATNATQIFGLFELDTAGNVLYSRIDLENSNINPATNLIGRNFFEEVAVPENATELRRRFQYFAGGSRPAEKFTFTYQNERQPVEVKIMLTQITEREFDTRGKLIIMDIRKVN